MKNLFLVRGLPGSGKTTFVNSIKLAISEIVYHLEADMYFTKHDLDYEENVKIHIAKAHNWCQECTEDGMLAGIKNIFVSNTFTQQWELDPYIRFAKKHNYVIHILTMDNHHRGESIHNVPESVLENMEKRFERSVRS